MLVDLTEDRCLLANAHGIIGLAKYLIGRGEETETRVHEALRLCRGDTFVYFWMTFAGVANLRTRTRTRPPRRHSHAELRTLRMQIECDGINYEIHSVADASAYVRHPCTKRSK